MTRKLEICSVFKLTESASYIILTEVYRGVFCEFYFRKLVTKDQEGTVVL